MSVNVNQALILLGETYLNFRLEEEKVVQANQRIAELEQQVQSLTENTLEGEEDASTERTV